MQGIESIEYSLHVHDRHQEHGFEMYLKIPPARVRKGMTLI